MVSIYMKVKEGDSILGNEGSIWRVLNICILIIRSCNKKIVSYNFVKFLVVLGFKL